MKTIIFRGFILFIFIQGLGLNATEIHPNFRNELRISPREIQGESVVGPHFLKDNFKVSSINFSADESKIQIEYDNFDLEIDLKTKEQKNIKHDSLRINSTNGKYSVVEIDDTYLVLRDNETGIKRTIDDIPFQPELFKFSKNSEFLAIRGHYRDGAVFHLKSGKRVWIEEEEGRVISMGLSSDGSLLALGTNLGIEVLEIKTNKRLVFVPHSENNTFVDLVVFSNDDSKVISYDEKNHFKIIDVKENKLEQSVEFKDEISSVNFSQDGKKVVVASLDKQLKVFDLNQNKVLMELYMIWPILTAEFSHDGEKLIIGGKYVEIYDINTKIKLVQTRNSGSTKFVKMSKSNDKIVIVTDLAVEPDNWSNWYRMFEVRRINLSKEDLDPQIEN